MLNPGKGDTWYITCSRCNHSTEAYEDSEDARAEWDSGDTPAPSKPKKRIKKPAGKKQSRAALMREKIREYKDDGYEPDELFNHLVDYGVQLGFKTRGSAASCVKANLEKVENED